MNKICFSHGQESGPWGTKISAMAETAKASSWSVDSLDYRGIQDPLDRVEMLVEYCQMQPVSMVLVGSSMGGFVATVAASRISARGLFLLAPALYLPGYEENLPAPPHCPSFIVHGWRDEVVPWQGSVRYGSETGARLMLLDGDHRLTANIDAINRLFAAFLDELTEGD
ncbi:MAG: alpha/beta hydrolase [Gammaproteobacteria bacterium]|nr:alpha/beta hydrolase [Gammaproteobacteria bacterium]